MYDTYILSLMHIIQQPQNNNLQRTIESIIIIIKQVNEETDGRVRDKREIVN